MCSPTTDVTGSEAVAYHITIDPNQNLISDLVVQAHSVRGLLGGSYLAT
jgi:hypothetical protein